MNRPIIIGAGVAGLAAANYLVDSSIFPIIIEADIACKDKVCGEFISPQAVTILNNWGIETYKIDSAIFNFGRQTIDFKLNQPAGSLSRSILETKLLKRAISKGADILQNTKIINIIPPKSNNRKYSITLSNSDVIECDNIFIAAGKFYANYQKMADSLAGISSMAGNNEPKYMGIKSHFEVSDPNNILNFFVDTNSYCGLTINGENSVNLCCLAKIKEVNKFDSVDLFMKNLITKNNKLNQLLSGGNQLHEPWLICKVNGFGSKEIPDWPNAYFIGDAATTIAPVSGNGISLALLSGIMACKYAIADNHKDFYKDWHAKFSNKLAMAKLLHKALLNPIMLNIGFRIAGRFPTIASTIYTLMR